MTTNELLVRYTWAYLMHVFVLNVKPTVAVTVLECYILSDVVLWDRRKGTSAGLSIRGPDLFIRCILSSCHFYTFDFWFYLHSAFILVLYMSGNYQRPEAQIGIPGAKHVQATFCSAHPV